MRSSPIISWNCFRDQLSFRLVELETYLFSFCGHARSFCLSYSFAHWNCSNMNEQDCFSDVLVNFSESLHIFTGLLTVSTVCGGFSGIIAAALMYVFCLKPILLTRQVSIVSINSQTYILMCAGQKYSK